MPPSSHKMTGRSSSYYRRQPRFHFVQKAYRKLKRLLRDLVYWAKRHPVKVFLLVIMPLVTGGALTALLARFGLRLPPAVERMLGIAARTAGGDSIGLVGEAVRIVSSSTSSGGGGFGSGSGSRRASSQQQYAQYSSSSGSGGSSGRTDYTGYSGGAGSYGSGSYGSGGASYGSGSYGAAGGGGGGASYDDYGSYGSYGGYGNGGRATATAGAGYDSGYGSRTGGSTVSVERGRDGGLRWERKREESYTGAGGYDDWDDRRSSSSGGSSRRGGGFMDSVSRFL